MHNMANLLTTKELQDLLKLDRTTIYRMLKDGRIAGIRVGGQWRFSRESVDALIGAPTPLEEEPGPSSTDALPLHCIRPIQQVFAEIAQVGAFTAGPDGTPLTELSNSCSFCTLLLKSDSGRKACMASWHKLARQREKHPRFEMCHAGLEYARATIEVDGNLVALVVAGQFYARPPDRAEEKTRVEKLARTHGIQKDALASAAKDIKILDKRHEQQLGGWLTSVAGTFEQVAHERKELMSRLRNIAEISTLPNQ
jgi:excisionase family DNA binding protein